MVGVKSRSGGRRPGAGAKPGTTGGRRVGAGRPFKKFIIEIGEELIMQDGDTVRSAILISADRCSACLETPDGNIIFNRTQTE